MMRPFILLFICLFLRINCFTLALSDNITKSPSIIPDDSENEINKYLCQGETLNITCPNNFVIMFDDANFGRRRSDRERCRHWLGRENTHCDNHKKTLKVLNDKCHEQQQCFLPVNKDMFGNPCFGVIKYLYVKYHCNRKVYHGM
ncbi:adhesion G protein-coupled receptor L2-like [Mytilus trossulus]|uniref:adhesion G protein-coupled receptor L2-like n=1 Tax=Mytilus trossulus TaxID=6551 RepID=UPI0030046638